MGKQIFDEKNGLWYEQSGDYFFQILGKSSEDEPVGYGKYGMLRKTYLKEYKSGWYQSMLLQGKLNKHLNQIDREARERVEVLSEQMKEKQGMSGAVKEADQMRWCGLMNNIRHCAEEIVLEKLCMYK